MSDVLNVELRESHGSRNARRMRQKGRIPAVVYGHGQPTVSVTLASDQVAAVLRHGGHVVELQGAVSDKALIKDLQWDTFGLSVLHIDLARVAAGERVRVELPVEVRGAAPGLKQGGVLKHLLHNLEFECPADNVPEKVVVNVNHLEFGQSITVGQMALPTGMSVVGTAPEEVVVQCVEPVAEVDVDAAGAGAEPELIGRKPKDEAEAK